MDDFIQALAESKKAIQDLERQIPFWEAKGFKDLARELRKLVDDGIKVNKLCECFLRNIGFMPLQITGRP